MNDSHKKKANPIVGALTVACITTVVFIAFFPWFSFAFAIVPLPIITDVVVALVDFPSSILDLEIPEQDSFGYKGTIATWFWSPFVFLATFVPSFTRRKKRAVNLES